MFKLLSAIIVTLLFTFVSCSPFSPEKETKAGKVIIGETAFITIEEAGLIYDSRIDTGATTTSLNAYDIKIHGEDKDKQNNINKLVTFKTRNRTGKVAQITTRIVNVVIVANSQGREARYVVDLTLKWKGKSRKVRVNLRDRRNMTYKLLIGRNWLNGHYLVDVSKKEHGEEKAAKKIITKPAQLKQYNKDLSAAYWDKSTSALYPTKFSLMELDGKKMFRLFFPGQTTPVDLPPSPNSKKSTPVAYAIITINGKQIKTEVQLMKNKKGVDLQIGTELKKLTSEGTK